MIAVASEAIQVNCCNIYGLLFLAIRIKAKIIVPGIIVHGLFDFPVMLSISILTV